MNNLEGHNVPIVVNNILYPNYDSESWEDMTKTRNEVNWNPIPK